MKIIADDEMIRVVWSDRKNWLVTWEVIRSRPKLLLIRNDLHSNATTIQETIDSLTLLSNEQEIFFRNDLELCLERRRFCDYLQVFRRNESDRICPVKIISLIFYSFMLFTTVNQFF